MAGEFIAAAVQPTSDNYGKKGSMLDLSGTDVTMTEGVKGIMVVSTGNLIYRPLGETTGFITVTAAPVGFIPAHIPGIVRNTANGTTATVATIED